MSFGQFVRKRRIKFSSTLKLSVMSFLPPWSKRRIKFSSTLKQLFALSNSGFVREGSNLAVLSNLTIVLVAFPAVREGSNLAVLSNKDAPSYSIPQVREGSNLAVLSNWRGLRICLPCRKRRIKFSSTLKPQILSF